MERSAAPRHSAPSVGAALVIAGLLCAAPCARAQSGVLRGIVNDSTGVPIADADVGIVSVHRLTRTDDKGRFTIDRLAAGSYEVTARRLGYKPETISLAVSDAIAYSYTITLTSQPTTIDGVDVTEKRRRTAIEGFYERRTRGIGVFFTRDDLLARQAHLPSDMLRSTPGVRIVRGRSGQVVRFTTLSNARPCTPALWIDGQLAPGAELDDMTVTDIEGMEVYQSLSTTPAQFARGNSTPCGTIVVWSRPPGG